MSKPVVTPAPVTDEALLKAMDELATAVKKGDRLLEADTEGGLSTQGEPLSKKTPKGVVKADACSDDESSDDGSTMKAKKSCKHVYKGQMACKSCSASVNKADDDSSDDDSSDDGSETSKSLRNRIDDAADTVEADENGQVDVAGFLKSISSELGEGFDALRKSVDDRLDAHVQHGRDFNMRVAKALTMIGNGVNQIVAQLAKQEKTVQKALGQPVFMAPQRQMLTRQEIMQPSFEDEPRNSPFQSLTPETILNYLCEKAERGDRSVGDVITEYEVSGHDPAVFDKHPFVRKSLLQDLCG